MAVEKLAISFPPDLLARVREDAEAQGESISAWLVDAASRKLRAAAARAALETYEAEQGGISEAAMSEVRARWPG